MAASAPSITASSPAPLETEAKAVVRRRRRHFDIGLWLPVLWVSMVTVGALTAPWLKNLPLIRLQSYKKTSRQVATLPSLKHWLGTDELGRDIFSRLVWGGRVALAVGVVSVAVAMLVGGAVGLIAGFYRGRVELVLNTLVGALLAFPALVLVLAITAFLGHNLPNITVAIAVVAIPAFARVAYANTLSVSQREYVMAARSLGAKNARIIRKEVLPNVVLPLSAFALVVTAVAIVAEGGLAFLGLSLDKPTPTWGSMINDGRKKLTGEGIWHVSFIPIGCMFLTVLALNVIGDKLRQRIDPRDAKV